MEELLRILEKNARMPIEDIAAMLDKTPEEIAAMMDEAAAKATSAGMKRWWTGNRPASIWWRLSSSCA